MNIKNMISLVSSGYSVADIKEINELAKAQPEIMDLTKTGTKLSDIKELLTLAEEGEQPDNNADRDTGESDRATDAEKVIKEQEQTIENLKNTVKEIQKENARKEVPPQEEADIFASILESTN